MNSRKISNTLTLCILLFTPILYAASGENGSNAGFSIFGNGGHGGNGGDAD